MNVNSIYFNMAHFEFWRGKFKINYHYSTIKNM
jgi:hypothetical protein